MSYVCVKDKENIMKSRADCTLRAADEMIERCFGCPGPTPQKEKEQEQPKCKKCGGPRSIYSSGLCRKCYEGGKPEKEQEQPKCEKCGKQLSKPGKTGMCLSCFNKDTGQKKLENKEKLFCKKCGSPRSYGSASLCRDCFESKRPEKEENPTCSKCGDVISLKSTTGMCRTCFQRTRAEKIKKEKAVSVMDEILKPKEIDENLIIKDLEERVSFYVEKCNQFDKELTQKNKQIQKQEEAFVSSAKVIEQGFNDKIKKLSRNLELRENDKKQLEKLVDSLDKKKIELSESQSKEHHLEYLLLLKTIYEEEKQKQGEIENIAKLRKEYLAVAIDHLSDFIYTVEVLRENEKGDNKELCDWCDIEEEYKKNPESSFKVICKGCRQF